MRENEIELLTAYVDGELSDPERMQTLQLLHDSSEARGTLWQLLEAAHALKQLPPKKLPADFANKIVEILERQPGVSPTAEPVRPSAGKKREIKVYFESRIAILWAVAACLLLAVGGLLALFLLPREQVQIAEDLPQEIQIAKDPPQEKENPPPIPAAGYAFRDLKDDPEKRAKLTQDLAKENLSRLDVTVHDSGQAIKKARDVFKKKRIELIVAPDAQASLDQGKKADYRILVENLPPAELAGILGGLGADQSSADIFDRVQVLAMTAEERNISLVLSESKPNSSSRFLNPWSFSILCPALPRGSCSYGSGRLSVLG